MRTELFAALRASPEAQRRQRRQPPQRPRHSRPAVLPEAISPAAGRGSEMRSTRSGFRRGLQRSVRHGLGREKTIGLFRQHFLPNHLGTGTL